MIAKFNSTTLQKQVGCFNHGVVILAAYKLELPSLQPIFNTLTTLRTSVKESLQMQ